MSDEYPYPIVKTLDDIEANKNALFVGAICCVCGERYKSLTPNAIVLVTKGCIVCRPDTHDDLYVAQMANDGKTLLGFVKMQDLADQMSRGTGS